MTRLAPLCASALALWIATPSAAAPPTADVHDLEWFVHVDLIDPGMGLTLAFYQFLIDTSQAESTQLLEGNHGPADTACCTRLERSASVTTFGSAGDGLDVLDSAAEYTTVTAIGSGSRGFLVDSITFCGGPAPTSIGCGALPVCDGDGSDDPDLWLILTLDAYDGSNATQTLAHERGHNACLDHVDTEECQLMRSGAGGGCIDATECSNFQAARTTTGGTCGCHDDSIGTLVSDGSACTEIAGGLCSGGVCGDPSGAGAATLIAAGGAGLGSGETTDDTLLMSGLTGGWLDLGPIGMSGEVVTGLAYAADSGILYGTVPSAGDDAIVTIDPVTGEIAATVGTIANGTDRFTALAYDPGPTTATTDDRLLVLESDGTFDELRSIDPASPNTTTLIGPLAFGATDGFLGLAYDAANDALYASSPFADGIYEVSMTCAPFCGLTQQTGLGLERFDSGLSWSPDSGLLHLVGGQLGLSPLGPRTLYDTIDPSSFQTTTERIQVDAFTAGGLASLPNASPQAVPAVGPAGLLALAVLTLAARRRALRRS